MLLLLLATGVFAVWRWGFGKRLADRDQSRRDWQTISGRWSERGGVISNSNYGRGDMQIAQHSRGSDYRISADIRFDIFFADTEYGDAGLVIRATDPQPGVDSYQGYYAGIRPNQQTIVLGRASYDWQELSQMRLPKPITPGTWYHLELAAKGCKLIVTMTPEENQPPTRLEHEDPQCLTEGLAGLRSFYAQASWRNIRVDSK